MEIFRFKKEKFNLENFIHYYNDNIEELLMEYPHYVSRICLIDRDYMDVIIFDEDYEYLNDAKDYKELLVNGEYALHFAIGKTYENEEKVELIDGIKFAILGYMFVQGLPFVADNEEFVVNKKTFKGFSGYVHYIDSIAKDKKLSIMDVLQDKTLLRDNISFVLKNVSYKIKSHNSVAPINEEQYIEALENYSENLFGMYYVPTNEFMLKKQEDGSTVPYGLYRFNFDRTYLSCNITKDLAFSHIALIGKQYAETDDATFNVNEVQKASIVAFAQFDGKVEKSTGIYDGGVQYCANQILRIK